MSQDYVQQSANIISDALDVGADSHYSGTSPVQAGDQFASLASLQANGSQERFSPALQLLSLHSHGGTGAQYSLGAVTNTSQGSAARHGAGGPSLYKQQQSQTSEKQLCTFFLRTGQLLPGPQAASHFLVDVCTSLPLTICAAPLDFLAGTCAYAGKLLLYSTICW